MREPGPMSTYQLVIPTATARRRATLRFLRTRLLARFRLATSKVFSGAMAVATGVGVATGIGEVEVSSRNFLRKDFTFRFGRIGEIGISSSRLS